MTPKVTYAITAKNEVEEMKELFNTFREFKIGRESEDTEVIILLDSDGKDEPDWSFLLDVADEVHRRKFTGDFAAHKNYLNSLSHGEWIFQIDADELVPEYLLEYLPDLLDLNKDVDLILVPRINIVSGITQEHVLKWGWNQNDKGWINHPDYQTRLYKNKKEIRWERKVHERIVGFDKYTHFPSEEEYSLIHVKSIERQERQNEFYETL